MKLLLRTRDRGEQAGCFLSLTCNVPLAQTAPDHSLTLHGSSPAADTRIRQFTPELEGITEQHKLELHKDRLVPRSPSLPLSASTQAGCLAKQRGLGWGWLISLSHRAPWNPITKIREGLHKLESCRSFSVGIRKGSSLLSMMLSTHCVSRAW